FVAREVSNHNAGNAAFLDVSVDRWRADREVYVRGDKYWWFRYNEETGKLARIQPQPAIRNAGGSQLVAGPDGCLYLPTWPANVLKHDHEGKAKAWTSPFRPEDAKHARHKSYKKAPHALYAPVSMTFLAHTLGIRHDGHIFMLEPRDSGGRPPKMLVEYEPSGKRLAEPVIWKVSDVAVGPKFDPEGNIYIAEQVKPKGRLYPPEFSDLFETADSRHEKAARFRDRVASMYGSIVKFSPKGGMIHWPNVDQAKDKLHMNPVGIDPFAGEPRLDPALPKVEAAYFRGAPRNELNPVKITGALWLRLGISHVEMHGCNCTNTRFDVDEFGRVWYPDLGLFRVGVLDTNGNLICHFGGYGNAESMGPDSPVIDPGTKRLRPRRPDDPAEVKSPFAEPEIAFAWLAGVGVTDRYAYMGDTLNRRLLRVKLVYAAEETCNVK
ncbi:MAG: hypothetical protein ACYTGB_20450, partial [Planctomycetota bacterium]